MMNSDETRVKGLPAFSHRAGLRRPAAAALRPVVAGLGLLACLGSAEAQGPAAAKADALTLHAEGVQIYDCKVDASGATAWSFREPLATLMKDGKTIGRHFAGPTWELSDGSAIVGKVTGQTAGATAKDLAILKLDVTGRRGQGELSGVTRVQRLNTHGGVFSGACGKSGSTHVEPYSADYVFSTQP